MIKRQIFQKINKFKLIVYHGFTSRLYSRFGVHLLNDMPIFYAPDKFCEKSSLCDAIGNELTKFNSCIIV